MQSRFSRSHLPVRPEVEEPAGGVVRARPHGVARRVELDGVDVGLVALEVLHVVSRAHVPDEGHLVAGAGDERVGVGPGGEVHRHHVGAVTVEGLEDLAGLHVPQGAGGVAGARQDL